MAGKPGYWSWWIGGEAVLEELRQFGYPGSMAKHATRRVPILRFWRKFGTAATVAAFTVSRATLFRWKKELQCGQEQPQSTAPHRKRTRMVDERLIAEIVCLRTAHPGLGKDKLRPLLVVTCLQHDLPIPSVSTVGRVVGDLTRAGRLPDPRTLRMDARTGKLHAKGQRKKQKKRRRKGYQPKLPGDLLQLDTIVTYVDGVKRYTLTAIDLVSRFAFAWSYTTGSSRSAADFLAKLQEAAPFPLKCIQTDNGSEFHKDFTTLAATQGLTHYWNYPRYPKGNAYVERFNRTIQEEWLCYHKQDLATNLDTCNSSLIDYLIWYNTKRPHYGLDQQSPLHYLNVTAESQMYWTHTNT